MDSLLQPKPFMQELGEGLVGSETDSDERSESGYLSAFAERKVQDRRGDLSFFCSRAQAAQGSSKGAASLACG